MNIIERFIHLAGRFAVGLGIGLALVSTVVIVRTDLGADTAALQPEVVRLDPVVVTMSAEGFRAARAGDAEAASTVARLPVRGAGEG